MKGVRKEYLSRLIEGVRKQITEDPDTIQAQQECGYDDITIARWIDATLLCAVIEEEVLANEDIPTMDKAFHWDNVVTPHHMEIKKLLDCIESLKNYAGALEDTLGVVSEEVKNAGTLLEHYDYDERFGGMA